MIGSGFCYSVSFLMAANVLAFFVVVFVCNTVAATILNFSGKIIVHQLMYIALAVAHNTDALRSQFIYSAVADAAGEHHAYTHFGQIEGNVRFTSAAPVTPR
jgi:hypothetical protein